MADLTQLQWWPGESVSLERVLAHGDLVLKLSLGTQYSRRIGSAVAKWHHMVFIEQRVGYALDGSSGVHGTKGHHTMMREDLEYHVTAGQHRLRGCSDPQPQEWKGKRRDFGVQTCLGFSWKICFIPTRWPAGQS